MKQNKGFTLVELLAVIVILAVIALIATPQVLSMIEASRVGAAESSMLSYVDAAEKAIVTKLMNATTVENYARSYDVNAGNALRLNGQPCLKFEQGKYYSTAYASGTTCPTGWTPNPINDIVVDIKGDQPQANVEGSILTINSKNVVTVARLKFGKYYVAYYYDETNGQSVYCASDAKFFTKSECQASK